ncbi:unnamed protein product [Ixodes pacificus]
MKRKAKLKKMLFRLLPVTYKFRTTRYLVVLLSAFALFSVYLSNHLASLLKSVRYETNRQVGTRQASLYTNMSSTIPNGVGVDQKFLKTSQVLLDVLLGIEEDQLSRSRFDTVVISGNDSDVRLLFKKTLEAQGYKVIQTFSTNALATVNCDSDVLWICMGTCSEQQQSRQCNIRYHKMADHHAPLSDQLGRADNLCNIVNTLRKYEADAPELWSFLPLCFVLPEQTQQLRDVAEALGYSLTSSGWQLKPVRYASKRQAKSQHISGATIADVGLLQKVLSPALLGGKVVAQQLPRRSLTVHGRPVTLRVWVLVTSLAPLRAHVHNHGTVLHMGYQKTFHSTTMSEPSEQTWPLRQFWSYLEQKNGPSSVGSIWAKMKAQIAGVLAVAENRILTNSLIQNATENISEFASGSSWFQLLSFDYMLSTHLQPFLTHVNVRPSLERHRSRGFADFLDAKIIPDVIRMLTARRKVAPQVAHALRGTDVSLGLMGFFCRLSHDICLTENDIAHLVVSRRMTLARGGFDQLYPSPEARQLTNLLSSLDQNIQRLVFSTSRTRRGSVHDVSQQHQTAQLHELALSLETIYGSAQDQPLTERNERSTQGGTHCDRQRRTTVTQDLISEEEQIDCVQDQASLPYLRWLRVSPAKELTPAFHPNVTEYRLDVPYDQLVLRVRARALYCHAEARLDDRLGPARPINYTLGLGYNRVSVVVVDIRHPEARVANAYVLTVFRRPEISDGTRRFDADRSYAACNLKQSCELKIYPREPCGLQREAKARTWASMLRQAEELKVCHSGHESGRWVLPCENCNIAETCFWNEARWMPVNCRYADIANLPLQDCLAGKKLLFVGDSTNRGMMYYVLMRLNGTLGEWHKSHGILLHRRNLNGGRTDAGFAYYPQFWLPTNRRPPLGATLRQLVNGMAPLENSARTVLVVGGVHWLGVKHLTSLAATLKSLNLGNVKVIVKTFGSGFHQKADGVHQVAMVSS